MACLQQGTGLENLFRVLTKVSADSLMLFCSGVPAVDHWTWQWLRIIWRVSVEKSKEKTEVVGVNLMRSQVLYRAAQVRVSVDSLHSSRCNLMPV